MPKLKLVRYLEHLDRDRGYRFQDKRDPVLEFITNDITDSGWPIAYVSERSGVSSSTLHNWMKGKTKHPQNVTVEAVLKALGWKRPISIMRRQRGQMQKELELV